MDYESENLRPLEMVCRSCFLVVNRFTSPDGKRCAECAELDRLVYDWK